MRVGLPPDLILLGLVAPRRPPLALPAREQLQLRPRRARLDHVAGLGRLTHEAKLAQEHKRVKTRRARLLELRGRTSAIANSASGRSRLGR